ncbi:MAG TPA: alkaline phosphatase, partial [Spirochaetota bacterium]|nr:alkaline phosphatase [Spirochaetota bacterium]
MLLIGDGMGFEEIRAAELFNGKPFAVKSSAVFSGSITTFNYSGEVTDSAASATAMATGEKVSNGVISRRIPGNSSDLKTVFETAKSKGYRTGLITTSYIIDATPAAFISHSDSRADYCQISLGIFNFKPNLTIGGLKHLYIDDFALNGFAVYESLEDYSSSQNPHIFIKLGDDTAQYEYDTLILSGILPHNLSRSAAIATNYLNNTDKFILLVEGGRIDHAGHSGSIENNVYETNEFFISAES